MPELLLRLYVAGDGARSRRAMQSLRTLCASYGDRAACEVVDVVRDPEAAERARVLMTPTLVLERDEHAGPARRVIGDLSDLPRVVDALGLPEVLPPPAPEGPDAP